MNLRSNRCPHNSGVALAVTLTSRRFASLKACRAAVRAAVDRYRTSGEVFESALIAELLVERHYALKPFGDRYWPRLLRWTTHPEFGTPQCFTAEFALLGWRKISFNKAIDGWELNEATLDAALAEHYRRLALPFIFAHRDRHPSCEVCGGPMSDVHHVAPTFEAIAQQTTALLSAADRAALIRSHDWFDEAQPWRLPKPCADRIGALHADAHLISLCKLHHHAAHGSGR